MGESRRDAEQQADPVEYVGSPTAMADAQEVPEWVAMFAKLFFFLPAALVTATTIPLILMGLLFACGAACVLVMSLRALL